MRALILLSSLGFMLSTLSSSAGQELCADAVAARGSVKETATVSAAVDAFYAKSGKACVWSRDSADDLIAAVRAAPEHGLDAEVFGLSQLADRRARDETAQGGLDIRLTATALKYAMVMTSGVGSISPGDSDSGSRRPALQKKLIDELKAALDNGRLEGWLKTLPPQTAGYERMRYALGVYRDIDAAGGWETLPASLAKKSPRRIAADERLARRLMIEGDLSDNDGDEDFNPTVEALKHFQRRHGLAPRGKLDKPTIDALNVSARARVLQIAANMERWRVYTRIPPSTRVEVNAAAATATLFRDNEPVMRMNAVVGRPKHDTPILQSNITTIIINPPWIVPKSIIDKEILPAIEKNPDYLERHNMAWSEDGSQLIQEPGPRNSLGRIKFEFPNSYGVYLHDTNAHALFNDVDRAQSHGCVRLERPLDLAEDLLKDNEKWSREAIEDAIREGTTIRVPLGESMPVTLAYWTAFVDDDGTVQFRPDVYGRDPPLAATLMPQASLAEDDRGT